MSEAARRRARYKLTTTGSGTITVDETGLRLHLGDWIRNPAGPSAFLVSREPGSAPDEYGCGCALPPREDEGGL
jgi:hypothetical protein